MKLGKLRKNVLRVAINFWSLKYKGKEIACFFFQTFQWYSAADIGKCPAYIFSLKNKPQFFSSTVSTVTKPSYVIITSSRIHLNTYSYVYEHISTHLCRNTHPYIDILLRIHFCTYSWMWLRIYESVNMYKYEYTHSFSLKLLE